MMTEYRIKEILRFHNGRGYDSISEHGLIPVYGSGGVMGYTDKSLLEGEYILLPRKGSLNNYFYINKPFWNVDTIYAADVMKDDIDCKYLYYYFKCLNLGNLDSGSTLPSMTQSAYGSIKVKLPSRDTQKTVAKFLTTIDDIISVNNKIIETSEKLMREIYDYWFVQFDFPDENGRPYKSSGGEMVYDEKLKREIPKGWNIHNILDVSDWVGGAQPPKSTFIYEPRDGYVRFIQNRDYTDDNYKTWIPESKSNKICDRLDIMMDKYGDAGRIRFGLAGAYNVALAKIAIEKENLREYIRGFLSSEAIYQYLYNACMASTRASLNEEILGNLNLPMPSKEILNQYQTIAEQNIQLILTLSDENKQLASLRDWLLPMLMNGQVKIAGGS